jgi:hypothetical protein
MGQGQRTKIISELECPVCGAISSYTVSLATEVITCCGCDNVLLIEFKAEIVNVKYRG